MKLTKQQIANVREAIKMWKTVPPENVYPGLRGWRLYKALPRNAPPACDTIACFGGWCAWWPAFRKQGVMADVYGAPITKDTDYSYSVSYKLFGDEQLFEPSGTHKYDDCNLVRTDHEIVMNRLVTLLASAEEV